MNNYQYFAVVTCQGFVYHHGTNYIFVVKRPFTNSLSTGSLNLFVDKTKALCAVYLVMYLIQHLAGSPTFRMLSHPKTKNTTRSFALLGGRRYLVE